MTRSIRLSPDEAWTLLEETKVGIFTSLRRDGTPVSLPVWFAPIDGRIYLRGPATSKKFARVRNDERVSFLAERGERWVDLKAVHLTGTARVIGDEPDLLARIADELDRRYAHLRPAKATMPRATKDRYRGMLAIEISPDPRILSWDNSRLGVES
jgi:general stress protein 26